MTVKAQTTRLLFSLEAREYKRGYGKNFPDSGFINVVYRDEHTGLSIAFEDTEKGQEEYEDFVVQLMEVFDNYKVEGEI